MSGHISKFFISMSHFSQTLASICARVGWSYRPAAFLCFRPPLILSSRSCRICHCEGDEGPLITPCHCTGSLRFVHQSCLQQWIKSSDTRCCELCKYEFIMETKLKPLRKVRAAYVCVAPMLAVVAVPFPAAPSNSVALSF